MKAKSHIHRITLEDMFERIRARTKWNIDGDMLWGYFFFDPRTDKLRAAQRDLESQGYRFVELFEMEQDDKKTGVFMLHVERIETHTVDSLDTRNGEFDEFAARRGLEGYDGMDVGPVSVPPLGGPPSTRPSDP